MTGAPSSTGVAEFEIRDDVIRLSQLLKAAGLAASGAEAKELVTTGQVSVNGALEHRRGRQLRRGDLVALGDAHVRIV